MEKINKTTFKNLNKEFEVEIGDIKQPDFKPQIKLKRWDNECNFSCRLIDNETFELEEQKEKINYKNNKKEIQFYEYKNEDKEGFEFDIILKKKPKTNKIEFSIQSKELKFYYQPELTNEELAEGTYRPLNVVGSYAVYHASKGNAHKGRTNGEKYKSGKAFHIYRPKIFDSEGEWVWGELNIDIEKRILSVTISQKFLDNATYPIRNAAGLQFGYDTIGGTSNYTLSNYITGSVFAGVEGIGDYIRMYHNPSATSFTTKCAIYVHSDSSLLENSPTEEITGVTGAAWRQYNFITGPSISTADYVLVGWSNYTGYVNNLIYYDTGDTNQGHYQNIAYGEWPATASFTHENNKYSIYCVLEEAAGGTNIQINIGDAWKSVNAMKINIGDVWKDVAGAQVNIGDAWKTIF